MSRCCRPVVIGVGVVVALFNGPQVLRQLVLDKIEILDESLPLHSSAGLFRHAARLGMRVKLDLTLHWLIYCANC